MARNLLLHPVMELFSSIQGLERLLGFRIARHGVLASNLANAETPRYNAKDLVFSDALNGATSLATTDAKHVEPGAALAAGGGELQDAGAGVNLEGEMAKIAVNRVLYESAVEITRKRLGLLRYAATDGGQG